MKRVETNSVRRAESGDVEAIVALINAAFRAEAFFIDGDRIDADEVRRLLDRGTFLLATKDGRIQACVYLEIRGEGGYFGLLSVDPATQGSGLGRRLVAEAEDVCRAAGCATMEIKVVNLREELPPFYRRLGYLESGSEPFPADKPTKLPCHFLKMSKPL